MGCTVFCCTGGLLVLVVSSELDSGSSFMEASESAEFELVQVGVEVAGVVRANSMMESVGGGIGVVGGEGLSGILIVMLKFSKSASLIVCS